MGGFPPFAGFFSKYLILMECFKYNNNLLGIIFLLISVITCYYYLKVIKICIHDNKDNLPFYSFKLTIFYIHLYFILNNFIYYIKKYYVLFFYIYTYYSSFLLENYFFIKMLTFYFQNIKIYFFSLYCLIRKNRFMLNKFIIM